MYRAPSSGKPNWMRPPAWRRRRPRSPTTYRARESKIESVPEIRVSRMFGSCVRQELQVLMFRLDVTLQASLAPLPLAEKVRSPPAR